MRVDLERSLLAGGLIGGGTLHLADEWIVLEVSVGDFGRDYFLFCLIIRCSLGASTSGILVLRLCSLLNLEVLKILRSLTAYMTEPWMLKKLTS